MSELRPLNVEGQTVYIIGKGPSLLNLTAEMIGSGPVVTLNHAILYVRKLALPNPIYAMQKDGCVSHGGHDFTPAGPGHVCDREIVRPEPPETAVFSLRESPHCMGWYSPRIVLDVEAFALPWFTPSAPTATKVVIEGGCSEIVYIAHDAYTTGDLRRVDDGQVVGHETDLGYTQAGRLSASIAAAAGVPVRWVTP